MKKGLFLQSLICLSVMSCSVQELDIQRSSTSPKDVFYAYLESSSEAETRVFVDEKIKIHWNADDRISLFKTTWNQEFRFEGSTGDKAGKFSEASSDVFGTGNPIEYLCAVYPYNSATHLSNDDVLTLILPTEQAYQEGSFGLGANTMVSVTEGDPLMFKNVGGYLVLKFFGKGVSVSSIKLEGNSGEKLSGKASMTPVIGADPKITMVDGKSETSITLTCDKPVELDASKENATVFWMVVPPTTFSKGFTLTVTGSDGKEFVKKTDKDLSIVRNTLLRIAPIEVKF